MFTRPTSLIASFQDPALLSLTFSMEKRERAWYLFSCDRCQDRKDGRKVSSVSGALGPDQWNKPRYQVTYHTYLASGRQLSYTSSVERVVRWNMRNAPCKFCRFSPFFDCIMIMWEKIPVSSCFFVLQAKESWAGPGNEGVHWVPWRIDTLFDLPP